MIIGRATVAGRWPKARERQTTELYRRRAHPSWDQNRVPNFLVAMRSEIGIFLMRRGEVVSRRPHKPKIVGANPTARNQ